MSAKVYPKSAQAARKDNDHALRAEGDNLVIFNAAELYALRNAFDDQLDAHKIKGLKRSLANIVFRRTLPFYKLEEDMNSIRLQNLTGSRGDYCYRGIDQLVQQSIVLERRGYYGKILSINFNFSQWGKTPEENGVLVSDPEALLQTLEVEDIQTVIDNPDADAPHEENPVTLHDQDETLGLVSGLYASIEALKEEISTLKALLQDVLPDLSRAKEKTALCVEHQIEEPVAEPLATLEPCETQPHAVSPNEKVNTKHQIDEPISAPLATLEPCETQPHTACENEKLCVENQLEEPVPEPLAVPQAQENSLVAKLQLANAFSEVPASLDAKDLEFPEELKPHEKNAICKALEAEKIEDKSVCQLLLDDLKSRYNISDWQPIRSPVAYFRSLIRSLKNNSFVSDYAENYRENIQAEREQAQQQKQNASQAEKKKERQEAYGQYRQAALLASSEGCSLRTIAKRMRWDSLIKEMGFDLDAEPNAVLNPAV